ncbi:unnamed protein product [Meganyctiphanes norvegica]|uniref:Sepiapterin reductase n=1 Tax=Meganyctiphanes norvegica TaxID=48144 RepID=A0AAV2PXU3_MEGNR
MSEPKPWGVCWVVVTGASKGLGAEICVGFAKLMAPGSCIVGVARSSQGLKDTEQKVKQANPHVQFKSVVLDLGSADKEGMESALAPTLSTLENTALSKVLMVHNAGSLGDLQYVKNLIDHEHTRKYYEFNISSVITLNAIFMDYVKSLPSSVQCQIINISSLCAITPFKSWGLYCAGKAARDMFFKVLATEEPTISVLSYSPGPLDGDMQAQVRATSADDEIRTSFTAMKEQGNLLPIHVSVAKMLQVIHANKFKSGDHVDYYDEI